MVMVVTVTASNFGFGYSLYLGTLTTSVLSFFVSSKGAKTQRQMREHFILYPMVKGLRVGLYYINFSKIFSKKDSASFNKEQCSRRKCCSLIGAWFRPSHFNLSDNSFQDFLISVSFP